MNNLPPKVNRGTMGELIAQIYLLKYGVQAAPPLRDSGNDLIACKGEVILSIQVKTRKKIGFSKRNFPKLYNAAIFIVLYQNDGHCDIKNAVVYLMSRKEIESTPSFRKDIMLPFCISSSDHAKAQKIVDNIFNKPLSE